MRQNHQTPLDVDMIIMSPNGHTAWYFNNLQPCTSAFCTLVDYDDGTPCHPSPNLVNCDEFLVRVQAQVMTRDDSTGGWVPMGGGGLSNVGLRKLVKANGEDYHNEYLIYGERIADKSVVLDCLLKRDLKYVKANPKFHHWTTDDKKFGLTFERCVDASKFDKGIRSAVADLVDGKNELCPEGDEEVFAILTLPLSSRGTSSSQSASTTSTTTSSPTAQSPTSNFSGVPSEYHITNANHPHVHRIQYISSTSSPHHLPSTHKKPPSPPSDKSSSGKSEIVDSSSYGQDLWIKSPDDPPSLGSKSDQGLLDAQSEVELQEYSYVIFAKNKPQKPHEYSYPTLEAVQKPPSKREATSNVKRQPLIQQTQPPLPKKKGKKQRLITTKSRCKHCHEMFSHEDNFRGSCEDAPDGVEKCIEYVTCVCCMRGLIYHCMSDPDGDYGHPCKCDPSDNSNCKKWTALTILSLFVPCLWCYLPLMACHKCGVACSCCGGRHKAV
ncbi:hypothetical protein FSP39_004061 [Pinctada imbricata]|uniref:WH1 domain-containing protein n=1 Tax=Pinctada imbricata TaxID=66713 RepID=A0AA89BYM4_PINIB|nr:hypothetical protein FSP39_004061 [Pinctada imbricata]